MRGSTIIGIEPWSAAGPGWANQGVTAAIKDEDGSIRIETIYTKDFHDEAALIAFSVALKVWPKLEALFKRPKER